MKTNFKHAKITGILSVVPENAINIEDELHFYDNDIKKLERNKKILGLGTRYVVPSGITNNDLCEKAARKLIEEMQIDIEEIDALIVASSSHDYIYPASSCILHGKLALKETCACFDFSGLACSSYVYALWNVHSLIESKAIKKCLLLVGDTVSLHSDKRNRNSNMLFGDAGTATLIEYTEEEIPSYFVLGTQGKNWDKIIAPAGGSKLPIQKDIIDIEITDSHNNVWHLWDEILKGMDVFKFTMEVGPKGILDLLEFSKTPFEHIDFFAFHQANRQIVTNIAKFLDIPKEKFSSDTFTKYANCASASVLTNICDALYGKALPHVVLASFGVGLSYAFAKINLETCHNYGMKIESFNADLTREEQIKHWIEHFCRK